MDLLVSLCVELEGTVDEEGNSGERWRLTQRHAQFVVERTVLRHEGVVVFLKEGNECLLQGEQSRGIVTPEKLEAAIAVVLDNRVRLGHVVFDAALKKLQCLLSVGGLLF